MNFLFVGDIVGKKGREVIHDFLPTLIKENNIDFVIANGENAAHGKGITYKIYNEILKYGVDCVTMGNHTYSKNEINEFLPVMHKLVIPANHIDKKEGESCRIFNIKNTRIAVCNILGTAFMGDYVKDPYEAFDRMLPSLSDCDIVFVDFHGEATAEKRIFAEYYADKIDILVGTHTHVQTADEQILHDKVAFISDAGMCGAYDSVIGRDTNESIKAVVHKEKTRYIVSENPPIFCGVIISYDNGVKDIKRIQIRPKKRSN